jgi:excisionase family DNA binding protein
VAVTRRDDDRANHAQSAHPDSACRNERGRHIDADVVGYEAITPAVLSLEPMIVLDARGNELDLPLGRARESERGQDEETAEPQPPVLTVDELATLLRVNRKTVYEALSRGEIPGARRIGASYRILRGAVLEWLSSGQDRVARSRRNR